MDPREQLRAWLPHIFLLALVVLAGAMLVMVVRPLADQLILAGALVILTHPLAFTPVLFRLERWCPLWSDEYRRFVAAAVATTVVASVAMAAVLGLLVVICGHWTPAADLIAGLAVGDAVRLERAIEALVGRISILLEAYPALPLDAGDVRMALHAGFVRHAVGADVMSWLLRGTGGFLASGALTLVALFYLYAQGAALAGFLLRLLPLTVAQRGELALNFRYLALSVCAGTVLRALVHGAVVGLIAWMLAGANPFLIGLLAAFVALLPVVGPGVAWVPLASLAWSQGRPLIAACLAVSCLSAAWAVELSFQRLAQRLGAGSLWIGFLLFCGAVGGVAGLGLSGILIGPAAVVSALGLWSVLPHLYGVGDETTANNGGTTSGPGTEAAQPAPQVSQP